LFQEGFTDGNFDNNWYAGFNATGGGNNLTIGNMPGNPAGDNWVGSLSTFREVDSAGVSQSWAGNMEWNNYEVEADLYIPATGGSPFSFVEYYALEFRVDTNDVLGNTAAYQFHATFNPNSATGQVMRFRKRPLESSGSPVTIHQWNAGDIPGGAPTADGWHKFKVKAEGNQFWFWFNGMEMPGCPYADTTSSSLLSTGAIGVYAFRLSFVGNPLDTSVIYIDEVEVTEIISGLDENSPEITVNDFTLHQNFPNPFNPDTKIEFELKRNEFVNLTVYNLAGEKVKTLMNGVGSTGLNLVTWDATDFSGNKVSAGVYLYKLQTETISQTKKMILLK